MFRRAVVVLVVGCAGFLAGARPAHAFPEGEVPHVTCGTISIDPPSWVSVRFTGTVGGVAFDRTAVYQGGDVHNATVDIADLTTGTGPLAFHINADSAFLGHAESEGTITCNEAPKTSTSTTSVSSTSTTMTSPTTVRTSSTTVCSEPRGCCVASCEGPSVAPADELPKTGGTSSGPVVAGLGALGGGAALLLSSRRRRTS